MVPGRQRGGVDEGWLVGGPRGAGGRGDGAGVTGVGPGVTGPPPLVDGAKLFGLPPAGGKARHVPPPVSDWALRPPGWPRMSREWPYEVSDISTRSRW